MHLSLIGMSGCGKTHWSEELARQGFKRFCCDDLITKKLVALLTRPDGTTMDLGEWMGFPYESRYEDHEAKYLDCETEVLRDILEYLESNTDDAQKNVIVDTTGSVIYTGDQLIERLRKATTVVYLATPPEVQAQMLQKYLRNQRPVLWRGMFTVRPGETNEEALARCYPALLAAREKHYARCAAVTIDYHVHNQEGFQIEDLMRLVNGAVRKETF